MNKTLKKIMIGATAALALAGGGLAATSADAQPWHGGGGGWHGGGGWGGGWHGGRGWRGPGPAIAAGFLGVAIGESLAHPYYGAPPAYYAGPGYWGYYGGCRAYWRWSPAWGRYVRVERCY